MAGKVEVILSQARTITRLEIPLLVQAGTGSIDRHKIGRKGELNIEWLLALFPEGMIRSFPLHDSVHRDRSNQLRDVWTSFTHTSSRLQIVRERFSVALRGYV